MALTRRTFLQHIGVSLTALGLSDAVLLRSANQYQVALAQPTRRKLALLIGINQYPEQVCDFVPPRNSEALTGCLTDVELQRELLIYRFGFHPDDILTLTNQAATRQAILDAFQSHLIDRTRLGDIVVVHFSGLGSQINLTNSTNAAVEEIATQADKPLLLSHSLVPIDGNLPTQDHPILSDLTTTTLLLLLRSLPTDQVTTVLDLCYTNLGQPLQGHLRVRSRPNAPSGQIHPSELALQAQLSRQSGVTIPQAEAQWRSGQLPGVLCAATQDQQIAAEVQWNGFSAGLFTYALTQQLWLATAAPTIQIDFGRSIATVKQTVGQAQQPLLTGQKGNLLPAADLPTQMRLPGADGVITAIEDDGQTARVWLGGLPAIVAEYAGSAELSLSDAAEVLQVRSREGLVVKAVRADSRSDSSQTPLPVEQLKAGQLEVEQLEVEQLEIAQLEAKQLKVGLLKVGQFVQEAVRMLPRNIGLTVALDKTLERIERVDATSAFAAIPKVVCVKAGEQSADFVFGKVRSSPETITASLTINRPAASALHGYGLFSLGRNAILSSLTQEDEAVKTAVHRLEPQLRSLLAMKLLRLTENQGSSRLGVQATLLAIAPRPKEMPQATPQVITQQRTNRAPWNLPTATSLKDGLQNGGLTLPIATRVQYQLQNYSDRSLYFLLLGFDTQGNAIALTPPPMADGNLGVLPPQEVVTIPAPNANVDWTIQAPVGLAETHLIFSRSPFKQAYKSLISSGRQTDLRRVHPIANPLEVAQAILEDLHQTSTAIASTTDIPTDSYRLDVNAWATFSFVYQVIDV